MFGTIPEFNQSMEMLKTMWGQGVAAGQNAGQFPFSADPSKGPAGFAGFPGVDIDELEKRIKDLKSVENWLSMNLNILKTTIQGLEVQHATLLALKSFGEAMTPKSDESADSSKKTSAAKPRKTSTPRRKKARGATFLGATGD
jgi:hypothetical protein